MYVWLNEWMNKKEIMNEWMEINVCMNDWMNEWNWFNEN